MDNRGVLPGQNEEKKEIKNERTLLFSGGLFLIRVNLLKISETKGKTILKQRSLKKIGVQR